MVPTSKRIDRSATDMGDVQQTPLNSDDESLLPRYRSALRRQRLEAERQQPWEGADDTSTSRDATAGVVENAGNP